MEILKETGIIDRLSSKNTIKLNKLKIKYCNFYNAELIKEVKIKSAEFYNSIIEGNSILSDSNKYFLYLSVIIFKNITFYNNKIGMYFCSFSEDSISKKISIYDFTIKNSTMVRSLKGVLFNIFFQYLLGVHINFENLLIQEVMGKKHEFVIYGLNINLFLLKNITIIDNEDISGIFFTGTPKIVFINFTFLTSLIVYNKHIRLKLSQTVIKLNSIVLIDIMNMTTNNIYASKPIISFVSSAISSIIIKNSNFSNNYLEPEVNTFYY